MIRKYLDMIKFSHTIFALPFALIAVFVATSGQLVIHDVFWIIVAMAGARSGAMGFNRWVDQEFDAANPRTKTRPSVTGAISPSMIVISFIVSYFILVVAAYQLNPLALYLSPVAIGLTMFYSLTKRFSSYSHYFLGLAIGSAPIAAWIAVTGTISIVSLILGLSVLFWIAGFDILYALQDIESDKNAGLYSLPAKLGINKSIWASRFSHTLTVGLWLLFYYFAEVNYWFLIGILTCTALLIWEHFLVNEDDLSRLDQAFFNMNGYISVTMLFFTILTFWIY